LKFNKLRILYILKQWLKEKKIEKINLKFILISFFSLLSDIGHEIDNDNEYSYKIDEKDL